MNICMFNTISSFPKIDYLIFKELGINVYHLKSDQTNKILKLFDILIKFFKSEIIYYWFMDPFLAFLCVFLSNLFHKKNLLIIAHEKVDPRKIDDINEQTYNDLSPIEKFFIKFALKYSTIVLPISDYSLKGCEMIIKKENKLRLYPGIDTNIFKKLNIEKKKYLLTTGYQHILRIKRKGFLDILEVFEELAKKYKDFKLIYLGNDKGGRKVIQNQVKIRNLDNKVVFKNFPSDIISYVNFLNKCFIYLQYSKHETFGISMCEAMACGIPVIASNKAALPEIINNCGLIAISKEDLLKKIELLINENKLYTLLSKKSIFLVKKFYSKDLRKRKLEKVITFLLNYIK
ncbi:MAG: glycosyltransferase family 4 protein [Promethearchaeota archaeon]